MEAVLITRINANEWREEILFETVVPPLMSAQKVQHFSF